MGFMGWFWGVFMEGQKLKENRKVERVKEEEEATSDFQIQSLIFNI